MESSMHQWGEHLHNLSMYEPMLQSLIQNLETAKEYLHEPWHRVWRNHVDMLLARVQARLAEIHERKDLSKFEEECEPFILANAEAREQDANARAAPRRQVPEVQSMMHLKLAKQVASTVGEEVLDSFMSRLTGKGRGYTSRSSNPDVCKQCNVVMKRSVVDHVLVCASCGYCTTYLDATAASITFGDEVEFNVSAYHRLNHWNEFINRFQARERVIIDEDSMKQIAHALHKKGIQTNDQVTEALVRIVTHELQLKRCYKHSAQIAARLSGNAPAQLSKQQSQIARIMFNEIQSTFESLFPDDTWLGNKYCMVKICQTMGWTEFLKSFPLLSGRDKMMDQERRMKAIFEALGWTFSPLA